MKRRKFFFLSALGFSAMMLPGCSAQNDELTSADLLTEPELLSRIWDETTIRSIGESYRRQFPGEDNESKLLNLLPPADPADSAAALYVLRSQIDSDFRLGDTVMVDGWILSRTEARQCALFSLMQTT